MIYFLFLPFLFWDKSADILEKVKKKYDASKTLYIKYTESITDGRDFSSELHNEFWFMKENYYKLINDEQEIMTDMKTVWEFKKQNLQVTINDFDPKNQRIQASDFLFNYSEDYNSIYEKEEEKYHLIRLIPKSSINEKSRLELKNEYIRLWIEKKNFEVRKIENQQKNGNIVTYDIHELKFNQNFDLGDFSFKVDAKKHEVIDLRF